MMMTVPWYIPFIKVFLLNTCISYTYFKILGKNVKKLNYMFSIIAFNVAMAIIYAFMKKYVTRPFIYLIYYTLFVFNFTYIVNKEFLKGITLTAISIAISLVSMLMSTIINFGILRIVDKELKNETMIEYLIIGIFQVLLVYLFFKLNRFKYGFAFLKETEEAEEESRNKESKNKLGVTVSYIIIIISLVLGTYGRTISKILTIALILGGIAMFEWIKKSITEYYKEKMKDRTVEIQQEQIKEKDKKIDDLQTELSKVLEINHKYNHRLSAMERAVIKLGNEMQANTEFAEEYGDILDSLSELSKEYKAEIESINKTSELSKTNIFSIDNLLDYMRQEAEKSKIEFKLKIEFDIKEIIENKIPKNKLETLLTDHIRDAIIAIENSENENRKIEVKFSNEEFYQVEFYDTGIEFEIETLLNIGLERTTTHKATGGTGIGFMTTFETLKECKASLEIEEFNNKEYTKAVIIGFDGKNEYRIHSYRAEEIKNKIQDNRIIID